jgi:hypothetical protein
LRRTKEIALNLPPKKISIVKLDLNPMERNLYEKLFMKGREVVSEYLRTENALKNYAHILGNIFFFFRV